MRAFYFTILLTLVALTLLTCSVDASCKGSRCNKRRKNDRERAGTDRDERGRREGNVDNLMDMEDKKKGTAKDEEKSSEEKSSDKNENAAQANSIHTHRRRAVDSGGDTDGGDDCKDEEEHGRKVRRHVEKHHGDHHHHQHEHQEGEKKLRHPDHTNDAIQERIQREFDQKRFSHTGTNRKGPGDHTLPLPTSDELFVAARNRKSKNVNEDNAF